MKRNKLIFALVITYVFFTSASFQHFHINRDKDQKRYLGQQGIRIVNKGALFHSKGKRYSSDEILVKFKPSVSEQAIRATIASYQTKKIKRIPKLDIYRLQIQKGETVEDVLYAINQNPDIEYAEPNYIAYLAVTPNDTLFSYQYALNNTGQSIGIPGSPTGKSKADIRATTAWEETKGDETVIIAIIDTGVDGEHPDLKNKIYSSGWDFVNNDADPTDDHGHGTHVAGIAAAETNNNEGIAGVAWNCKILPIKVIKVPDDPNEEPYAEYGWLIDAIIWAVDNGASVINLSLGGDADAQSLRAAVKYAFDNNVVVVAAAGNDGGPVLFPAAYDEYCIAVAATDYDDLRTDWSNFGSEIDVAAPGERVVGPVPTWYWGPGSLPYAFGFGTSYSTPHVAGLAALIKSIKSWLSAKEIILIILYSADDINESDYPGIDIYIGYGRMNMAKALVALIITTSK